MKKSLLYLGKDDEFIKELNLYVKKNLQSNIEIKIDDYIPEYIIGYVINTLPHIVYIDFTSYHDKQGIFDEIIFLKKHDLYKSILFVAIFDDKIPEHEKNQCFSSGFQYSYVKGGDDEIFYSDTLYLAFGDKISLPTFAQAKDIDKELEIGICSSISRMSTENLTIETDISLNEDNLQIHLQMFKDLEARSFKISKRYETSSIYPMTTTYVINYPYLGPWDEITPETIQKETVETWLELNEEKFIFKNYTVKIISSNTEFFSECYRLNLNSSFIIEFSQSLHIPLCHDDYILKKYPLIFFDLDLEENAKNNLDSVAEFINYLKSQKGYKPILIITNTPSKIEALRKAYGYEHIIATPDKLNMALFSALTKSFHEKKALKLNELNYFFRANDPKRVLNVFQKVIVCSLTEHEIIFISKNEIPMFSVMHLNLPISCFVTIVPSYIDSEKSSKGITYMGFIHGISDDKMKVFRKFINQIIYKPLEKFTPEVIEVILAQKELKQEEIAVVNHATTKNNIDSETKIQPFRRSDIKGKSKL